MINPGQMFIGTLLRVEPAGAKPSGYFVLRYDQFDPISKGLTVSVHHPSPVEAKPCDQIYVTPTRIDHDTKHGIITIHAQYVEKYGPAPNYETIEV